MHKKSKRFYKLVGTGATESDSVTIPEKKSFVITQISMTAPSNASCLGQIKIGNATVEAWQSDKSCAPCAAIDGPTTITVQLINNGGSAAAYMGVTIYYEENG